MPENKVTLITGGARGIGLALAKAFAEKGYAVVITGRDQARLQAAAEELRKGKAEITALQCDVREPASVEKLFAEIRQRYSTIDVLVNNAGVAHALSPVDEMPLETWKEVIDTNLTGMFLVTRTALPMMRTGSTIVNNLSVAAVRVFEGMSAYNASKFGGLGFTNAGKQRQHADTEIWSQFWADAPREKMISADTVAEAVLHAVSAPANATIEELRIGPTGGTL